MKQKCIKNNQGFSLVEVLVSLAIVSMIAGLMLANYRASEDTNRVVFSAKELAGTIRVAQNNSLGAVKYGTSTPLGGWGVHIDTELSDTSYRLFADMNDNSQYDPGEAEIEHGGRTVRTERNVRIASTTLGSEVTITFIPPHPITVIRDGEGSSASEVEVFLENHEGESRTVRVNNFGLIEVLR